MGIFELLKAEHHVARTLLEELYETNELAVSERETMFPRLKRTLELHEQLENEILLPVLLEIRQTRNLSGEVEASHQQLLSLLEQMAATPVALPRWTGMLDLLQEQLINHQENEEGEFFQQAAKVLSAEQQTQLGETLSARREHLTGSATALPSTFM